MNKLVLLLTTAALALGSLGCASTPSTDFSNVRPGPYPGVRGCSWFMVAELPTVPAQYQGVQKAVVVICVPVLEGVALASLPQLFVMDTWHLRADLRQAQNQPPAAVTSR